MGNDKVVLWYWRFGTLNFMFADKDDWFGLWYQMGEDGSCAKDSVEIDGEIVNPSLIPEYQAFLDSRESREREQRDAWLAESKKLLHCTLKHLDGAPCVISIHEDNFDSYKEIFGSRLIVR